MSARRRNVEAIEAAFRAMHCFAHREGFRFAGMAEWDFARIDAGFVRLRGWRGDGRAYSVEVDVTKGPPPPGQGPLAEYEP